MEFSGIGVDGGAHPRLPEAGPDRRVRAKSMGEIDERFRRDDMVGWKSAPAHARPTRAQPETRQTKHTSSLPPLEWLC
jgi:hypothetical protein